MRNPTRHVAAAQCLALAAYSFNAIAEDAASAAPSLSGEWISLILPLLLVVVAGVAALWLIKRRYAGASGNEALRIRSVLAVGPRERIVLLETERQMLVVGVCPTSMNTLAQWPLDRSASEMRSDTHL
jgi:flagellar protein FliO/FliZ